MQEHLKALLEAIDRQKSAIDALRPLPPEREAKVLQKFRLDWNYHSNAIEGNSLTYGETVVFLMEGLTAKGKPFKDHLDLKGHNEGIDFLMDLIKNSQALTEKTIRELHEIVLVEPYSTPARSLDGQKTEKRVTLGAYKTLPNHVKTPSGQIHYYATPEETPARMQELMEWLRDRQTQEDMHPIVLAALFHHRFVAIHPFDDGNGRMSRLLMNLLLMREKYPPVVVRMEDRNAYYAALQQADAGVPEAFVTFIAENTLRSLSLYLRGAKGESIEEPSDWEKQVALLKKSAAGNLSDARQGRQARATRLAQWLSQNVPIVWKHFQDRFKPFDAFFEKTSFDVYLRHKRSEVITSALPFSEARWGEFAQQILGGDKLAFIRFSYDFTNLIYELPAPPPPVVIDLTVGDTHISMGDQQWPIASTLPIETTQLSTIDEAARTFYQKIEEIINPLF